jgi:ATP-dependent DNA helicase MPH1
MSSSEFDIDIDEDDLREIEIIEQEAIQQTQQTPQSSAVVVTESATSLKREPASTGIQSPRTLPWTRPAPNSSPGRTLPWQSSLQSSSFKPTQDPGQAVKGRARPNEPRTHHYLDTTAAKTWIYPTNVSFREYQFNIVLRALFDNVLVSLPTGLGKTFIAATLMYNFYRWFPRSKIMFVAPTKPLVQQQVEACFQICGVPYSQTAMLTGNVSKPLRALAYEERRVFYMTPQTLSNDIKTGICDPKSIVCLVIDEAHRGTGNYAYGECVNLIRKRNPSFRILALSATPGSSVEQVQNVITALCIAKIEIRTEESMDLRQYVHKRNIDVVALPLSEEITTLRDLYSKILQKYLDRVKNLNDYRLRDPLTLSLFGVKSAKDAFFASPAGRTATFAYKGMIAAVLGVLTSLAHAQSLLLYHGIQPFYEKLVELQHDYQSQGPKISKTKAELLSNPDFRELMSRLKMLVDNPNTSGHPKLDRAASIIIDHFMRMQDQGQETRVMAFCQFRTSAAELVKQLKRHEPIIKPTIFVGQAVAKGTAGMKQKEQLDVLSPVCIRADIRLFKDSKVGIIMLWWRLASEKKDWILEILISSFVTIQIHPQSEWYIPP